MPPAVIAEAARGVAGFRRALDQHARLQLRLVLLLNPGPCKLRLFAWPCDLLLFGLLQRATQTQRPRYPCPLIAAQIPASSVSKKVGSLSSQPLPDRHGSERASRKSRAGTKRCGTSRETARECSFGLPRLEQHRRRACVGSLLVSGDRGTITRDVRAGGKDAPYAALVGTIRIAV